MAIFCPQCGTEAHSKQQFCRQCGVNLTLIGKALSLSETIARGDKGPMPRVREMMANFKVEDMGEEIGRGLEQMTREIELSIDTEKMRSRGKRHRSKRVTELTPEETYAHTVREGTTSMFVGIGLTIALFVILPKIVIPPDAFSRFPIEIGAALQMAWVIGLIPFFGGLGHLIGARMTKPVPRQVEQPQAPLELESPPSVTEHTTAFLDGEPVEREPQARDHRARTTG